MSFVDVLKFKIKFTGLCICLCNLSMFVYSSCGSKYYDVKTEEESKYKVFFGDFFTRYVLRLE